MADMFQKTVHRTAIATGLFIMTVFLASCYGTIHIKEKDIAKAESIDTASVERGEKLYEEHCQACHGPDARGNGELAEQFDPRPTDLLEPGLHITTTGLESIVDFPHYSSEALRRRIRHGSADMPEFKQSFTNTEIGDIIEYLKHLSRRMEESGQGVR